MKWETGKTVLALIGAVTVVYLFGGWIVDMANWLLELVRSIGIQ